jgi:ATP-dependent helicase/DNAse subunit B
MEEFALLEKHTQKQLTKLACELKKGIISPNPFKNHHNSCEYCRFAAVCKMQSRPTRPYVLFDRIEDVYQQMKEEQK